MVFQTKGRDGLALLDHWLAWAARSRLKAFVALIVLVLGWLLARVVSRAATRGLKRVMAHREIAELLGIALRIALTVAVLALTPVVAVPAVGLSLALLAWHWGLSSGARTPGAAAAG